MSARLVLAPGLELPVDVSTQKLAWIGVTGSGKTYAATSLAEKLIAAGVQVIALDPVGVWWGLRLAADGQAPGLEIPVFGGLRGDVPLEPTGGKLIADLVVDRRASAVIDVSQFEHDTDKARFAADFADRFFFRMKSAPAPVHLFLEECQEFAPQNTERGEERMLHAFQRMVRLGRNFGIGASLITQRPQDVNKKALNQAGSVFAFQVTGTHERKAVHAWISEKGLDVHLADELPKLPTGEAFFWSPGWLRRMDRVRIAAKKTFDASSTPEVGKRAVKARELRPIDLDALRDQMKATIERAAAEDPKKLRARIAELQRELAKKPAAAPAQEKVVEKRVDVPALQTAGGALDAQDVGRLESLQPGRPSSWPANSGKLLSTLTVASRPTSAPVPWKSIGVASNAGRQPASPPVRVAAATPVSTGGQAPTLDRAARAILSVLATYGDCQSGRLTLLAGYRWSGGFRNALGALRAAGYIEGQNVGVMSITPTGRAAIADSLVPLPQGGELIEFWLRHPALGAAERAIFKALVEKHPNGLTSDQLMQATGYAWSGGFRNALGALRTAGLIEGRNTETMRAAAALMEAVA